MIKTIVYCFWKMTQGRLLHDQHEKKSGGMEEEEEEGGFGGNEMLIGFVFRYH